MLLGCLLLGVGQFIPLEHFAAEAGLLSGSLTGSTSVAVLGIGVVFFSFSVALFFFSRFKGDPSHHKLLFRASKYFRQLG